MVTTKTLVILSRMGDLEERARELCPSNIGQDGPLSGQVHGCIQGRDVVVRYTWSRRVDGRGLERWTWYLDGKRINSDTLVQTLEEVKGNDRG